MLDWTHEPCSRPDCTGTTDCENFPTLIDRVNMIEAACQEYSEADGNSIRDFATDALLLLMANSEYPATVARETYLAAVNEWLDKGDGYKDWQAKQEVPKL